MKQGFPTPRKLITEITTPEYQKAKAEWIMDFVKTHGLGKATLHPYPAGSPKAELGLGNITIDIGGENQREHEDALGIIAHCDVVPPSPGQKKGWEGDIYYQRGSADMLGQIAALLLALKNVSIWSKRRVRVVITTMEEWYSEGAYAAGDDSNNLMKGVSEILTLDINDGTKTGDTPDLIVGGVGRVAMNVQADVDRLTKAKENIPTFMYPAGRDAGAAIFPKTSVEVGTRGEGQLFSVVHHGNEALTSENVIDLTRIQLRNLFGDDEFEITPEDRGGVPFSKPWRTDSTHPFVKHAETYARSATGKRVKQNVYGRSSDARFLIDAASKNSIRVPAVGFYAAGENIHGPKENVDLRSVKKLEKFIRSLMKHEGPLSK